MELSEEREAAINAICEEEKENNLRAIDSMLRAHLKTNIDTANFANALCTMSFWMSDQRYAQDESFIRDIDAIERILRESTYATSYIQTFKQMVKTSMEALIISNQQAEGIYLIEAMRKELAEIQ